MKTKRKPPIIRIIAIAMALLLVIGILPNLIGGRDASVLPSGVEADIEHSDAVIKQFATLGADVAVKDVAFGTPKGDLGLPSEILAEMRTVTNPEEQIPVDYFNSQVEVTWECADYDPQVAGTYEFTASVKDDASQKEDGGYDLVQYSVVMPTITVTVAPLAEPEEEAPSVDQDVDDAEEEASPSAQDESVPAEEEAGTEEEAGAVEEAPPAEDPSAGASDAVQEGTEDVVALAETVFARPAVRVLSEPGAPLTPRPGNNKDILGIFVRHLHSGSHEVQAVLEGDRTGLTGSYHLEADPNGQVEDQDSIFKQNPGGILITLPAELFGAGKSIGLSIATKSAGNIYSFYSVRPASANPVKIGGNNGPDVYLFYVKVPGVTFHPSDIRIFDNGGSSSGFTSVAPSEYTLTYHENFGNDQKRTETVVVTAGASHTADPSSFGWTHGSHAFAGWVADKSGPVVCAPGAAFTVNGNADLYATWTGPNQVHTVTFVDEDGGTVLATESTDHGYHVAQPADPQEKEGKVFVGWFDEDGKEFNTDELVVSDCTYKARYTPKEYTLVFANDDEAGTELYRETVAHGDKADEPAGPEREGYDFAGWYDGDDKFDPDSGVTQDATYQAKYTLKQFKVSYHSNYTYRPEEVVDDVLYGDGYTIRPDDTFVRNSNAFIGWNTDPNGLKGTSYPAGSDWNVTGDLELYAQWSAKPFGLIYHSNYPGGDDNDKVEVHPPYYGYAHQVASGSQGFSRKDQGYDFAGWTWTHPDGSEGFCAKGDTSQRIAVDRWYDLYAKWEPRTDLSYTVNYLEQGTDAVLAPQKTVDGQTFGEVVTEEAVPIEGYHLVEPAEGADAIVIGVDGNVITFYYAARNDLSYTAYYFEQGTDGQPVLDGDGNPLNLVEPKTVEGQTFGAMVSVVAEAITGFVPVEAAETISIGVNVDANLVTFYYTRLDDLSIMVKYLEEGSNAELADPLTIENRTFGAVETVTNQLDIPGYDKVDPTSVSITIGVEGNEVAFYYTKKIDLSYTVNYLEEGSGAAVAPQQALGGQTFLAKVEESAIDIEGYRALAPTTKEITIGADVEKNVINFYYTARTDLGYVVNYLKHGSEGAPDIVLRPQKIVTDKTFGTWVTENAIDIEGYDKVDPASASIKIGVVNEAVNFYYMAKEYDVSYHPNGGTFGGGGAAKVDKAIFGQTYDLRDGEEEGSELSRYGFNFIGWNTEADGSGSSYTKGQEVTCRGDLDLYAVWSNAPFTVVYHSNVEGLGPVTVTNQFFGMPHEVLSNTNPSIRFVREGYDFLGWTLDQNKYPADEGHEFFATGVLGSFHVSKNPNDLYAQWERISCTVTFMDDDGTPIGDPLRIYYGEKATPPAVPEKEDRDFVGWEEGGRLVDVDEIEITSDRTFTASYKAKEFTVIFNDFDGRTLKTETVAYGQGATAPPSPDNKSGWHFVGWDLDFSQVTSELAVTALYAINEYTVTFVDWDGTVLGSELVEHGQGATAPAPKDDREGWHFAGRWDTDFSIVTGNLTVKAVYEINKYAISFNDQDGRELLNEEAEYGTLASDVAPDAPVWPGYRFDGWCDEDGIVVDLKDITITSARSFTAKHSPLPFVVTYHANYGDEPKEFVDDVAYDQTYKIKSVDVFGEDGEAFERYGYTFIGWNTDPDDKNAGDSYPAGSDWNVDGDLALYARWMAKDIGVIYHSNYPSGTGNKTIEAEIPPYAYGFLHHVASDCEGFGETGWTFNGWKCVNPDGSETNYAKGTTETLKVEGVYHLYAQWVKNVYQLSFDADNGTPVQTQEVAHGHKAIKPQDPTKEGCNFEGWFDAGGHEFKPNEPVTGPGAYKARYSPKKFMVQFVVEKEEGHGHDQFYKEEVEYNKTVTGLEAKGEPTKTGYDFTRWIEGGIVFDENMLITDHHVFRAEFTPKEFTISYRSNYAQGPEDVKVLVTYGQKYMIESVNIFGEVFDRYGYAFLGWKDATGNAPASPWTVTGDLGLDAQWSDKAFGVFYYSNYTDKANGDPIDAGVAQFGDPHLVKSDLDCGYRQTGHHFLGWSMQPGGDIVYAANEEGSFGTIEHVEGIYQLYAQWRPYDDLSYTVKYLKYGTAEELATQKVETDQVFGSTVTESAMEIDGYDPAVPHSKTIQIGLEQNEITFYYVEHDADRGYTVNYLEQGSDRMLAPSKTVRGLEFLAEEVETAVMVTGYDPVEATKSIIIDVGSQVVDFYYTARNCRVAYHANGGVGSYPDAPMATYGQAYKIFDNADHKFTHSGSSILEGWTTNANGSGTFYAKGQEIPEAEFVADVILYAKWYVLSGSVKSAVIYHSNYGAIYVEEHKNNDLGQKPVLPITDAHLTFVRDGYEFLGWSVNKNDATDLRYKVERLDSASSWTIDIAGDKVYELYAQWAKKSDLGYTVNYFEGDADGKPVLVDGEPVVIAPQEKVGSQPFLQTVWVDPIDIDGYVTPGRQSVTIEARENRVDFYYEKQVDLSYTVNYLVSHSDDELAEPKVVLNQRFGDLATEDALAFRGYGWDEATKSITIGLDEKENVITFYYTAREYDVAYDANGGEGADADKARYGQPYRIRDVDGFHYYGYDFVEWNTQQDGSGYSYAPGQQLAWPDEEWADGDDGLTLYAIWSNAPFKVIYHSNYGEPCRVVKDQLFDSTYVVLSNEDDLIHYDYVGHDFLGWSLDKNDANEIAFKAGELGSFKITKDPHHLYAQWIRKEYTVTFVDWDGTMLKGPDKVEHGDNAMAPADPSRTGYTFQGWDTDIENVCENLTVRAMYEINKHTVTFKDWDGATLKTQLGVPYGQSASAPSNPSRTGYTFTGWSPDFASITGDLEVRAQYAPNNYRVSYDPNVAGGPAAIADVATYDEAYQVKGADTFSQNDFNFVNWNTKADETGETYVPGSLIEAWSEAEDVTLYAQWTKKDFGVFYHPGYMGSEDGMKDAQIEHFGDVHDVATDSNGFHREGWSFAGWQCKYPEGSEASEEFIPRGTSKEIIVDGFYHLYAQWERKAYTVRFEDENGNALATPTVLHGDPVAPSDVPTPPMKTGYDFDCWRDKDGDPVNLGHGITGNCSFRASYTIKEFTVSFKDWNGATLKTQFGVPYGQGASDPANPSRTGYTFAGWDKEFVNVTEDLEVRATYLANTYKVTYDPNYAEGPVAKENTATYDGAYAFLPINAFERNDFNLIAWAIHPDGSGGAYVPGSSVEAWAKDGDLVLYAQWSKKDFDVFYFSNYADKENETKDAGIEHFGDICHVASDSYGFEEEGYVFTGWKWTNPDKTPGACAKGSSVPITVDGIYRIEAQWEKRSDLSYEVNYLEWESNRVLSDQKVVMNQTFQDKVTEEAKELEGYDHAGSPDRTITIGRNVDGSYVERNIVNFYYVEHDVNRGYTVNYVEKGSGRELADPKPVGDKSVGEVVTEKAEAIEGYDPDQQAKQFKVGMDDKVGSKLLTFEYTAKEYDVTYHANGGSGTTTHAPKPRYGQAYVIHDAQGFNWNKHGFVEWNTQADGKGTSYLPGQSVICKGSAIYYAIWAGEGSLSYHSNYGAPATIKPLTINGQEVASNSPNRKILSHIEAGFDREQEGYVFRGWSLGINDANIAYRPGADLATEKHVLYYHLYARWLRESDTSYTVKYIEWIFDEATGEFVEREIQSPKKVGGQGYGAYVVVEADEINGYDRMEPSTKTIKIGTDHEVKFYYLAKEYDVAYLPNGGTGSTIEKAIYNQAYTIRGEEGFSRNGYDFVGWKDEAGRSYTQGQEIICEGGLILYAQWSNAKYKVIYHSGYGKAPVIFDNQLFDTEHEVLSNTNPEIGFVRDGWVFLGWSLDKNDPDDIRFAADGEKEVLGSFTIEKDPHDLYAQWERCVYTVTFMADGKVFTTQEIAFEGTAGAPLDPVKLGCDFDGWYDEAGRLATDFGTIPITGDCTFTARFKDQYFTVTFEDDDKTVLGTDRVKYGGEATAPADPEKTGYRFTGWDQALTNVTKDMTITASYQIKTYTIRFYDEEASDERTVTHGGTTTAPQAPDKEGYDFIGWFDHDGKEFEPEEPIIGDCSYWARYRIRVLAVTFEDWDGRVLGTDEVEYGRPATPPEEEPSRIGHRFTGWDPAEFSHVTEDMTITAQYEANTCTVRYQPNDAGEYADVEPDTVRYGESYQVRPSDTFKRNDFSLQAWTTNPDGSGRSYVPGVTQAIWTEDGDVTLYAKWERKPFGVTYHSNYKDGREEKTIEATTSYGQPHHVALDGDAYGFEKAGSHFTGWDCVKPDGSTEFFAKGEPETIIVNGYYHLFAKWEKNVYEIRFLKEDGSLCEERQVSYGDMTTAPKAPEKAGCDFVGWFDEDGKEFNPKAQITQSQTYTARYKLHEYTVTFNDKDGKRLKTEQVEYEKYATAPNAPAVTGHAFMGWRDEAGTVVDLGSLKITRNCTFKASYKANPHTVSYYSNFEGGPSLGQVAVEYGQAYKVLGCGIDRYGYTFIAWNTRADGRGTSYTEGRTWTVNGDLQLYAQWSAKEFGVYYHSNYAAEDVMKQAFVQNYGDAHKVASDRDCGFEQEGYEFIGWSVKPGKAAVVYEDKGDGDFGSIESVDGIYHLYAQWAEREDLSFRVNYYKYQSSDTLAETKLVTGQKFGAEVTEYAIDLLPDYDPVAPDHKTFTIGVKNEDVDFFYVDHDADRGYKVNYLEKDTDKVLAPQKIVKGMQLLEVVQENAIDITGYDKLAPSTISVKVGVDEELSFYYMAKECTISYHANTGSGSAIQTPKPRFGQFYTIRNATGFSKNKYEFVEWNTQADGKGTSYVPGQTATCTGDATLYARWAGEDTASYHSNYGAPAVIVTLAKSGNTIAPGQRVLSNTELGFIRNGYVFLGWSEGSNDAMKLYDLETITPEHQKSHYHFYAQWEKRADLSYAVICRDQGDDSAIQEKTVEDQMFGEVITEEAPDIPGYEKAEPTNDTITIGVNADDNVITFYYTKRADLSYEVNYLDKVTGEALATQKAVGDQTFNDVVTEYALAIPGYVLDGSNRASITIELDDNVITFYYTKRADLSYTVNYLEEGTGKELAGQKVVDNQTFQESVTEYAPGITGYVLDGPSSQTITIGVDGNVINFSYMKRADLSYRVTCMDQETGQVLLAQPPVGGQTFEAEIMVDAPDIPGYVRPAGRTITIGAGDNEVIFSYAKRSDLSYTVNYLEEGTDVPLADKKVASKQTFEASVTEKAINIEGYDMVAPTGKTITIGVEGNVFDFYYTASKYEVTYDANGGEGADVQSATYNQPYTIRNDKGFSYYGYDFVGWNTEADGSGASYTQGQEIICKGGLNLYAVWTNAPFTVIYHSNCEEAPVIFTNQHYGKLHEVLSNTSESIRYEREGYAFRGWTLDQNDDADDIAFAANDSEAVLGSFVVSKSPHDLYAQWWRLTYTVSFIDEDGSEIETQTVSHGDSASMPLAPDKEGYDFDGWHDSDNHEFDPAKPVTQNEVYVASYTLTPLVIEPETPGDNQGQGGDSQGSGSGSQGGNAQGQDRAQTTTSPVPASMAISPADILGTYGPSEASEAGQGNDGQEADARAEMAQTTPETPQTSQTPDASGGTLEQATTGDATPIVSPSLASIGQGGTPQADSDGSISPIMIGVAISMVALLGASLFLIAWRRRRGAIKG